MKSRYMVTALIIAFLIPATSLFGASPKNSPLTIIVDPGPDQTAKIFIALKVFPNIQYPVIYNFKSLTAGVTCETTTVVGNEPTNVTVTSSTISGNAVDHRVVVVDNHDDNDQEFTCPDLRQGPIQTTVTVPSKLLKVTSIPVTTIYYDINGIVDASDFNIWFSNR